MRRLITVIVVLLAGCNTSPVVPTASPTPLQTAGPTAAPSATPNVPPTPSPAATGSVLPSIPPSGAPSGLVVDESVIAGHLDAFQRIADANGGIRAAGTPGYDASADYVAQVMTDLGYQVERYSFEFPFFDETEPASVGFGDIGWTGPEWVHAALYSASDYAEATFELVGDGFTTFGCDASEWSGFKSGHVAGVYGGGCHMRQKVELAQDAGAVAVVSMHLTWAQNEIKRPTLLDPAGISIPVVVVGREPSIALANQEGNAVNVFVQGDNHTASVDNIIAKWPGQTERIVMLGGHLDSVLDGPGINDNGSGVATLLSLAASVAAQPRPQSTLKFGFWSAEEFGDLGSFAYVDALDPTARGLIDAYLNLDMVGSPNPGRFVYDEASSPHGSDALTASLLAAFEALGAPAGTIDTGGSSDHYAFAVAGIPVGGVFSGLAPMTPQDADLFGGVANEPMDPCYHLSCDTRGNVDLANAVLLGQATANVLAELAY
jgi:Zn-dependent M28 family amino/carboxypeptidase